MQPVFFATPEEFRRWLERHHATEREVWVGYYKKGAGKPSLTWAESVDEALCFGWIDGIRKSVDADSYTNRFTPRKRGSTWSAVNVRRMAELVRRGRVHPAGLKSFEMRDPKKSGYSFEQRKEIALDDRMEARFRRNRRAWRFFESQPPGYRRAVIHWVTSAKREETRERRLTTLIGDSAAGQRIAQLRREPKG